MTAPQADPAVLTSDIPEICDVTLDQDVAIDPRGLSRIMREITVVSGLSQVASFNSSI